MSLAMNKTPAELVGITDSVRAFYFTRGIWMFGVDVTNEAAAAEAKASNKTLARGARARVFAQRLRGEHTAGLYRDPAPQLGPKPGDEADEVELGDSFGG